MAEPGKARSTNAPQLKINIDAKYDSNVDHGKVDNGGEVRFNCAPKGALVYTDPVDAFDGETNGFLTLPHGDSDPFIPSIDDSIIKYCCCDLNSSCNPDGTKLGGGYTIQVGNPPEGGGKKK